MRSLIKSAIYSHASVTRTSACYPIIVLRQASTVSNEHLNFRAIEEKWHARWAERAPNTHKATHRSKGKAYVLPMFPYPSGNLHLGHLRVYTISDVIARFKHMQGHEVIHPMGWDAFGLPAENAAMQSGVDPKQWTLENIARMKQQLIGMGGMWNWDREITTYDPSFYKHTQRIFLHLYEQGYAYRAEGLVNFDPIDQTVLANEQVDANGCSWRSGAKVEKIHLEQWFLKVTAFRHALFRDLTYLEQDGWPERVISMQKHWLGRTEGARIWFPLVFEKENGKHRTTLKTWTTRPDLLFGVQYLAISTTAPLVFELAKTSGKLKAFLKRAATLPPDSKEAYLLPDVHGINPLSDLKGVPSSVKRPLPVFVSPYVLGNHDQLAVAGVPGHDLHDWAFWKQNGNGAEIKHVVAPSIEEGKSADLGSHEQSDVFTAHGVLTSACGDYAGSKSYDAIEKVVNGLRRRSRANFSAKWGIRDWLISRQRYWGTPIPIVHCPKCGPVPVPASQLPVELPHLPEDVFSQRGGNPLKSAHEWVNTKCPKCKGSAKRETDTMDTFVDSSWYFLRFADPNNKDFPFSGKVADAAMPVDIYIGGVEHATLHLLYARFMAKFLSRHKLWPSGKLHHGEPFKKLITQGMVHGKTYSDPHTSRFLKPSEVDASDAAQPRILATGEPATVSYEKMSKSKHNGVDPGDCITKYGADATRAHILFQAPITEVLDWDEDRIVGIHRWMNRVWRVVIQAKDIDIGFTPPTDMNSFSPEQRELWTLLQDTIQDITTSFDKTYSLNTVVSSLIKLTNALAGTSPSTVAPELYRAATCGLIKLMAPITPALAEECWATLHPKTQTEADSVFHETWPTPLILASSAETKVPCAVQIDGKVRFSMTIPQPPEDLVSSSSINEDGEKQTFQRNWVISNILHTEEGREWAAKVGKKLDLRNAARIIVANGGRIINFVFKQ